MTISKDDISVKILDSVRIDRWLWAVRICKTRSVASSFCERLKVKVDGSLAKPSRKIKPQQIVQIKKDRIEWQYKVLKCIENRVGAKEAVLCKEDLTPQDQLELRDLVRRGRAPSRPKGMGRPTKKDRRDIDKLLDH